MMIIMRSGHSWPWLSLFVSVANIPSFDGDCNCDQFPDYLTSRLSAKYWP